MPSLSHYVAFLDRLTDLGVDLSEVGSWKQPSSASRLLATASWPFAPSLLAAAPPFEQQLPPLCCRVGCTDAHSGSLKCIDVQNPWTSLWTVQALLLNPFDEEPPAGCRHELRRARLDALDDKERR